MDRGSWDAVYLLRDDWQDDENVTEAALYRSLREAWQTGGSNKELVGILHDMAVGSPFMHQDGDATISPVTGLLRFALKGPAGGGAAFQCTILVCGDSG